jgi:hypothetical protein
MDPFEKPYWSKLQVELWVCTRRREAVGLAEHAPGRPRLADTSIGPDGSDEEAYDQDTPTFDDEIELIGTAITNYGFVCQFNDARKEVVVALSKGQLQEHQDRSTGVEFFEREEVLRLWPDPRLETLRAETEPLTLAEGVALLVRGRPASRDGWARLRRRAGGRFPTATQRRIEAAGQAVVGMIRNGIIVAFGFRCHSHGGIGFLNPSADDKERLYDDQAFLAHQLWVDPCTDAIWTEPDLGDGHLNPTERGYRYVCLSRMQFLEAVMSHHTKTEADCKPAGKQRLRTIGGVHTQLFGHAAVLRARPEGSVALRPEAKVPSESLNAADCAEAPARNLARKWHKATIPPAPKRGPSPRYHWSLFHDALDQLIREKPDVSQADVVRAMSDWCATNWSEEDGPGEPANSMVRQHIAAHPGAPWAKSKVKAPRKRLSRRAKTSAKTSA